MSCTMTMTCESMHTSMDCGPSFEPVNRRRSRASQGRNVTRYDASESFGMMRPLTVDYNARPTSIAMDSDADMVLEERRSEAAMRRRGKHPSEGLVLNSRTILDGTDNRKLRTADAHKCKRCGMTVPRDEMEVHAMHCRHSKASLTVQEMPDSSRLRAKPCEPASIPAIGAMRRVPSETETSPPPRSSTVPPTGCRKLPS